MTCGIFKSKGAKVKATIFMRRESTDCDHHTLMSYHAFCSEDCIEKSLDHFYEFECEGQTYYEYILESEYRRAVEYSLCADIKCDECGWEN